MAPLASRGRFFLSSDLVTAAFAACLLGVIYTFYSLAFPFGLSFDDFWNLRGLGGITDRDSALEFVFGGAAGPTGRPLALLSFLPRAASWPGSPDDFLFENTAIHLINVLLVMWLAYRLARHLPWPITHPGILALQTASVWGLSPLLFSTNLMIVQRMTSLSALFCLVGLIVFVIGRQRQRRHFWQGLVLMSMGIGGGTLLAVLCKENGALLPGFALVLESSVLAPSLSVAENPTKRREMRIWLTLFLVLPVAALVFYLVSHLGDFSSGSIWRDFTLAERLLSESRIVLTYLRLLILPIRSELGPYQDDFPISHGLLDPVSTLLSIATIVLGVALAIRWRAGPRRLLTMAVAWFLWGHLLESTVVPLELYFEHRNYLPAVGVYFALAAALSHPLVRPSLRVLLLGTLLINSSFVLREMVLLWRDPLVASAVWHHERPASLRSLQLHLIKLRDDRRASQILDAVARVQPPLADSAEFAMIRLAIYCDHGEAWQVESAVKAAIDSVSYRPLRSVVTETIDALAEMLEHKECPGFDSDDVFRLLDAVLANPNLRIRGDTRAQAHEIYARLIINQRNLDQVMHHLESAFLLRPTLSTGIAMAGFSDFGTTL